MGRKRGDHSPLQAILSLNGLLVSAGRRVEALEFHDTHRRLKNARISILTREENHALGRGTRPTGVLAVSFSVAETSGELPRSIGIPRSCSGFRVCAEKSALDVAEFVRISRTTD